MEIRSFDLASIERYTKRVSETVRSACTKFGAAYEIEQEMAFSTLYVPETSPLLKRLKEVYHAFGMELQVKKAYGGSDAAWLFRHGIDALNIGIGIMDAHALTEHIAIRDLAMAALIVERLMYVE